ncbi:MAG: N-acetylmuramoyl-L-alanine amidase family protein, partial [Gorillibacterium sp.]|nr:N-acetylmuramoyl-L-alanine amidase family protein [Gorillibacterium sp.]
MKKIVVAFLSLTAALLLFLPTMTHAATNSPIRLYLNEEKLEPTVLPYMVKDTTMVPLRIITESLGANLQWDKSEPDKITVIKDDLTIVLYANSAIGYLNGEKVTLPVAPVIKSGYTMLPVRFLAERFNFKVVWDDTLNAVLMNSIPPVKEGDGTENPPILPNELTSLVTTNDQFIAEVAGAVKPSVYTLTNPDRVVVDLPNTSFGTMVPAPEPNTMGSIISSNPLVTGVRYAMNNPETSTIRIVLETVGPVVFELKSKSGDHNVIVSLMKVPVKKKIVVIDAGHGDQDPGAKSVTGKSEKTFNLAVSKKVEALLKKEPLIEVHITRSDDT